MKIAKAISLKNVYMYMCFNDYEISLLEICGKNVVFSIISLFT